MLINSIINLVETLKCRVVWTIPLEAAMPDKLDFICTVIGIKI